MSPPDNADDAGRYPPGTVRASDAGARILVVDDDPGLLDLIEMRLTSAGYSVSKAASGLEGLDRFREDKPRVVICDLRMDGMDGHAVFAHLHSEAPTVPVIILTAHGTIPDAVAATQRGVFGFLTKPFDGFELLARVADALAVSPRVTSDTINSADWRKSIASSSVVMEERLRQAYRAAEADEPVLISGPRGSGKESFARAIHAASSRAIRPFIALRCGKESRSTTDVPILTQALTSARGGILFLGDVEELTFAEQALLLPLVQERALFSTPSRTGATKVRVIAATTQTLEPAVRENRFRADLYYALSRISLDVPPLTERRDDIPTLISHFTAEHPGPGRGFSPEALMTLQEAHWPGNVRQLRNVVSQALARTVTPQVPASQIRQALREESEHETTALDEARREFERNYLVQLLDATRGSVSRAARIAKRNRTEFYKLLARHGIDPTNYK